MPAYLVTWNPSNWDWTDLHESVTRVASGIAQSTRWSIGARKSLPLGSRMFLMRLGVDPKGIIASGTSVSVPYEAPHWDAVRAAAGDTAQYTDIVLDVLLDPTAVAPLDPRQSSDATLSDWNWTPQGSGVEIPDDVAIALMNVWQNHHGVTIAELGLADVELSAVEGVERMRLVRHRSRERSLRKAKIAAQQAQDGGKLRCVVPRCGFDFHERYGQLGKDYA